MTVIPVAPAQAGDGLTIQNLNSKNPLKTLISLNPKLLKLKPFKNPMFWDLNFRGRGYHGFTYCRTDPFDHFRRGRNTSKTLSEHFAFKGLDG